MIVQPPSCSRNVKKDTNSSESYESDIRETPTSPSAAGVTRRDFIKGTVAAGVVVGGGLGAFYFGYDKAVGSPLRVGVIGTGDEGSVLIGAINPEFIEVKSIADIRPYNVWRAFHGDHSSETALAARPGLMAKYGWKTEDEARRHVKVYDKQSGGYEELIKNAKDDGLEAVIIALPLHLHAPAAIAAMKAGLHVITEKLMAHSVHECKDMARVAEPDRPDPGHRPPAALQHPLRQRGRLDPARRAGRPALHPRPVEPRQPARQGQLAAADAAEGQARRSAWPRSWRRS